MDKSSINLFIFAHQDDEAGCFFEIDRLLARVNKVVVAYMTSGTSDGGPSLIRNNESLTVLEKLGVDKSDIFFLGTDAKISDGKLCQKLKSAFKLLSDLVTKIGIPENIYFHAWEGGHQDHDAVHLLGLALGIHLNIIDKCWQFPFYTGSGLPSILFKLFSPISENGPIISQKIPCNKRLKFISYCLDYSSQKKTWLGLLPFFLLHYIFWGTQILQPVSILRAHEKPHKGKLLYERRGFYSYDKFAMETSEFLEFFI